LTTSEPFLSATRVRPPGVISMPLGRDQHERPQIDMARGRPDLVKIGTVESASVGWAI
jgi:hypothetical protein